MSLKKIYKFIAVIVLYVALIVGFSVNTLAQASAPKTTPPTTSKPTSSPTNSSSTSTNTLTTPSTTAKPDDLCGFGPCLAGTTDYASGDSKSIITKLAINLVNFLIFVGAAIAVFFVVLGGYKYITANGEDSKVKEGRSMVINALIGIAIAIASFTLVSFVTSFISTVNIGSSGSTAPTTLK